MIKAPINILLSVQIRCTRQMVLVPYPLPPSLNCPLIDCNTFRVRFSSVKLSELGRIRHKEVLKGQLEFTIKTHHALHITVTSNKIHHKTNPIRSNSSTKMRLVLKAALLLVFFGIVTRCNAQANCSIVNASISRCANLLGVIPTPGVPSRDCCIGLQNITQASATLGDGTTCKCISNSTQLSGLIRIRLIQNLEVLASAYQNCRLITPGIGTGTRDNIPWQCLFNV